MNDLNWKRWINKQFTFMDVRSDDIVIWVEYKSNISQKVKFNSAGKTLFLVDAKTGKRIPAAQEKNILYYHI